MEKKTIVVSICHCIGQSDGDGSLGWGMRMDAELLLPFYYYLLTIYIYSTAKKNQQSYCCIIVFAASFAQVYARDILTVP